MISLKNISKSFSGKVIFDNASLDIKPGDNFILTGSNGSGKTTLLMILKNLYLIDDGEYLIDSSLLNQSSISYISKRNRSFFMRLSVKQNIEFFYNLCTNKNKASMSEIYFMLKKFNLFDYLDEEFMSLSSGQAQKLSIIRGLMKNPILTLFDESFSSLDSSSKDMFKEIYKNHLEKDKFKATIWVTHNKYELDFKNKKILKIFDGKIHSEDNF